MELLELNDTADEELDFGENRTKDSNKDAAFRYRMKKLSEKDKLFAICIPHLSSLPPPATGAGWLVPP